MCSQQVRGSRTSCFARPNLSLAANLTPVTFPSNNTTLSGTLTRAENGVGISGKQVILEHKPAGATAFTQVDNPGVVNPVTTGANGNFSLTVQPTKNTEYRVTFAGDHAARLNASTSDIAAVKVKVGLTLKVSRATVKLGKKVTISGAVSPAHTGSVQLTIKRGARVVLTKSVLLDSSSLYKLIYKPKTKGSYSVTAVFAQDDDHLGNTATATFKVRR